MRPRPVRILAALAVLTLATAPRADTGADLRQALASLPADASPSGILLDRVVGLSPLLACDGGPASPALTPADLRQIIHELRGASDQPDRWPSPSALRERARDAAPAVLTLTLVQADHHRLRDDVLTSGLLGSDLARPRARLPPGSPKPASCSPPRRCPVTRTTAATSPWSCPAMRCTPPSPWPTSSSTPTTALAGAPSPPDSPSRSATRPSARASCAWPPPCPTAPD